MIIYEDGTYQSSSSFPDTLYDENAKWCLPDNSELAQKYLDIIFQGLTPKLVLDKNEEILDVVVDDVQKIKQEILIQINLLKAQLSEGDYKITKCYEAFMTGETMPYDIKELKEERDELRYQINELEKQLN